jgi:Zn-dependent protease with chaperone function
VKFFERQEDARRRTTRLRIAFAFTVLVVVLALDVVLVVALGGRPAGFFKLLVEHPAFCAGVSAFVALPILIASRKKWRELQEGGTAIARELGALPVTPANRDPASMRLRNVVEEMALAARMPVPALFILREERGINAFAAGLTTEDAAIVVTQGALDVLDRAELQAVIGHEFSHVLNGDMALNLRMVAWLHGLYALTHLGERIRQNKDGKSRGIRSWVIGWMVSGCGLIGYGAGRVLQAATSRARERLADASSVQFTRDPQALKSALLKIAGMPSGSRIDADGALGVAHMFFASGASPTSWRALETMLATHPTLIERLKALDPSFDPRSFGRLAREAAKKIEARLAEAHTDTQPIDPGTAAAANITSVLAVADAATRAGAAAAGAARASAGGSAATANSSAGPATSSDSGGRATSASAGSANAAPARAVPAAPGARNAPAGIEAAAPASAARPEAAAPSSIPSLHPPVPFPAPVRAEGTSVRALEALRQAAQTEGQASAIALAAVVATEPARRLRHLKAIAATFGPKLAIEVQRNATCLDGAVPRGRFLAIQKALDGVRALPDAERERLLRAVRRLAADDPAPSLFQGCFAELVASRCAAPVEPGDPLRDALPQLATFLALLARAGATDARAQQRAYAAAFAKLVPGGGAPPFAPPEDWRRALTSSLDGIARLHPGVRRLFRDAIGAAVLADGRVTAEESDLARAACVLMDVPPPAFGEASALTATPAAGSA